MSSGQLQVQYLSFTNDIFNCIGFKFNWEGVLCVIPDGYYTRKEAVDAMNIQLMGNPFAYDLITDTFSFTAGGGGTLFFTDPITALMMGFQYQKIYTGSPIVNPNRTNFAPYAIMEIIVVASDPFYSFFITSNAPYGEQVIFEPNHELFIYKNWSETDTFTAMSRGVEFQLTNPYLELIVPF